MDICRRDNIQPPEHLVIQSDNTTSQAKNSEAGTYLATLVGKKKFLSALLNFLIVGHTHEDIDQLFSVLLALVVRRHRFHTPMELVTEIQIAMDKVFADRLEEVSAHFLGEVYDFGTWLDAAGIHLHNAWVSREGVDAPSPLGLPPGGSAGFPCVTLSHKGSRKKTLPNQSAARVASAGMWMPLPVRPMLACPVSRGRDSVFSICFSFTFNARIFHGILDVQRSGSHRAQSIDDARGLPPGGSARFPCVILSHTRSRKDPAQPT